MQSVTLDMTGGALPGNSGKNVPAGVRGSIKTHVCVGSKSGNDQTFNIA